MQKIFFAVLFTVIFFLNSLCCAYAPEGKCFITMLNVPLGDSFLVETATENVLIDAGDFEGRKRLVQQLRDAGITRLEKIILTHPHADHIGGVGAVLKNFPVDLIIDNGIESNNPFYQKYRAAPVKFKSVVAGDVLGLGGGVIMKIYNPDAETVNRVNNGARSNPNNESIVGKLIFGDLTVLFTGDIERIQEERIYKKYHHQLKAVVLKAPHHGSRTSSSEDFIDFVDPTYVFISAGENNPFGHPHKQPLATYRFDYVLPENIFCTKFNGVVRIESDGKNHELTIEKCVDWVEQYTGQKITVTRIL